MSAQWPVEVAVIAALAADAALATVPAYVTIAPKVTVAPYFIVGDSSENAFRMFQREGYSGVVTIHIYANTKSGALTIYDHLERVLDGVLLVVAGHELVQGRVSLVTTFQDPDTTRHHAVARYTTLTQVAA